MPDALSNPSLFRSLGKLARGLSALFWGLPAALLVSAETARADWLKPLGFLPVFAINILLVYALWLMHDFQKQERPWRHALDRAQLLALVNLGLCPFIYWRNKMPDQPFFDAAVLLLELSGILFLFNLYNYTAICFPTRIRSVAFAFWSGEENTPIDNIAAARATAVRSEQLASDVVSVESHDSR